MLKSIRDRLWGKAETIPACVDDGRRIYAIGDVHGRVDLLTQLLDMIREDTLARTTDATTQLIFLGDLIDRGPDSRAVVELVRDLCQKTACTALMGNHEEVLISVLEGNLKALPFFLRLGGSETLESYGLDREFLDQETPEVIHDAMLAAIPDEHQAFFKAMPSMLECGDYLFVHAGIRPRVPVDAQAENDMHWIRNDFLDSKADHGRIVVHGHSITQEVDERTNRIGIDTGAYSTGHLTAIGLEAAERWYLTT